jgi:transcriptional regulator with XRE-family HTH domain
VPRIKTLRRTLGLTQEEFAGRYHIPLGTLRVWELGHTEPDQPARAISKQLEAIQRQCARLQSAIPEETSLISVPPAAAFRTSPSNTRSVC